MITVIDNFLPQDLFKSVHNQIKNCDFNPLTKDPAADSYKSSEVEYPGMRTEALKKIMPFEDSYIIQHIDEERLPFTSQPYTYWQYAHLRVEDDNKNDFIHTDGWMNFAWLLYLSKTNLESGTKFYTNDNDEHTFVRFVENRFVIFDCNIKHRAFNNHGKDLKDGRLTVNGFAAYDMDPSKIAYNMEK
jgi:hypothetical protein